MRSVGEATLPNILKYERVKVTQRLSSLFGLPNREGDHAFGVVEGRPVKIILCKSVAKFNQPNSFSLLYIAQLSL